MILFRPVALNDGFQGLLVENEAHNSFFLAFSFEKPA